MAKKTYFNLGGIWKNVQNIWANIGGTWKQKVVPMGLIAGVQKAFIVYSIYVTSYLTSSVNSFPDTMYVNQDGYGGHIAKTGGSYVISGGYSPSDTIFVTEQLYASYNSGGYVGTLNIYVYSGSAPVSKIGKATLGTTYEGAPVSNLPDTYNYSLNGYTGQILGGVPYVFSGSDASCKVCTLSWGEMYSVNGGVPDPTDITAPTSIHYDDGSFVGEVSVVGMSPLYMDNYNLYIVAIVNGTSWSGYLQWDYSATICKSDTRIFRRDYSGTVSTADTRVYRYQGYVTSYGYDTRVYRQNYGGDIPYI